MPRLSYKLTALALLAVLGAVFVFVGNDASNEGDFLREQVGDDPPAPPIRAGADADATVSAAMDGVDGREARPGDEAADARHAARVRGRLVDDKGHPVRDCTVVLRAATARAGEDRRAWRAQSADNGRFELALEDLTEAQLSLDADDWIFTEAQALAHIRGNVHVGDLRCTRPATLRGEIRLAKHAKRVSLVRYPFGVYEQRNHRLAAGPYRLTRIRPGKHVLTFHASGHASKRFVVELQSGETRRDVTLSVGHSLRGRVVDDRGQGIEDASVHAYSSDYWSRSDTSIVNVRVRTNPYGDFTLPSIDGHSLELRAFKQDHASKTMTLRAPFAAPTLRLTRRARITGIVVDDRGRPVEGSRVYASFVEPESAPQDASGNGPMLPTKSAQELAVQIPDGAFVTDAKGRFDLRSLTPAPVYVRAVGAHVEARSQPVRLERGSIVRDLMLSVRRGAACVVHVRDAETRAVPDVKVHGQRVGDEHGLPIGTATTDGAGRATVFGLEPGKDYVFHAARKGFLRGRSEHVRARAASQRTQILLTRGATLSLHTTDAGEKSRGGVPYAVQPAIAPSGNTRLDEVRKRKAPTLFQGKSDALGNATLRPLAAGRYRVRVFARNSEAREATVEVREEQAKDGSEIRLALAQPFAVRVQVELRHRGEALPNTKVTLVYAPNDGWALGGAASATTDRTGACTIQDVAPGRYDARWQVDGALQTQRIIVESRALTQDFKLGR